MGCRPSRLLPRWDAARVESVDTMPLCFRPRHDRPPGLMRTSKAPRHPVRMQPQCAAGYPCRCGLRHSSSRCRETQLQWLSCVNLWAPMAVNSVHGTPSWGLPELCVARSGGERSTAHAWQKGNADIACATWLFSPSKTARALPERYNPICFAEGCMLPPSVQRQSRT